MKVHLNLRDAVHDTAPNSPPCFLNRAAWLEYLVSAAASQNQADEQKVILVVHGEPVFNTAYNFCEDCTQVKSVEMLSRNRCIPSFLLTKDEE